MIAGKSSVYLSLQLGGDMNRTELQLLQGCKVSCPHVPIPPASTG